MNRSEFKQGIEELRENGKHQQMFYRTYYFPIPINEIANKPLMDLSQHINRLAYLAENRPRKHNFKNPNIGTICARSGLIVLHGVTGFYIWSVELPASCAPKFLVGLFDKESGVINEH